MRTQTLPAAISTSRQLDVSWIWSPNIFVMILLGVTHPPAGGNPIVIILGAVSYDFLLNPIIFGSIIIIVYAIILNRFILKKNYPVSWKN